MTERANEERRIAVDTKPNSETPTRSVDADVRHKCEPEWANDDDKQDGYGVAIDTCYENEYGEFWVGNGEYGTRVNYCPFCGGKAPEQADA